MAITRIPEGLKLNKFEMSVIPHARKLVGIYGYAASPANQYSGDDSAPTHVMSKVESIKQGEKFLHDSVSEANE